MLVRRNDGGPGMDYQTIEEVEAYDPVKLVGLLMEQILVTYNFE